MPPLLFNKCRTKPFVREERHADWHRHRDRFPRQHSCRDRFRPTWQTARSIRRQRKSKVENSSLVCLLFKWQQWEVFSYLFLSDTDTLLETMKLLFKYSDLPNSPRKGCRMESAEGWDKQWCCLDTCSFSRSWELLLVWGSPCESSLHKVKDADSPSSEAVMVFIWKGG